MRPHKPNCKEPQGQPSSSVAGDSHNRLPGSASKGGQIKVPKGTNLKYRNQGELYPHRINQPDQPGTSAGALGADGKWERFDEAFTPLYDPGNGRPAIATRLMVGLYYLKHLYQLSDEDVVG